MRTRTATAPRKGTVVTGACRDMASAVARARGHIRRAI
jgi:hypothetical protein